MEQARNEPCFFWMNVPKGGRSAKTCAKATERGVKGFRWWMERRGTRNTRPVAVRLERRMYFSPFEGEGCSAYNSKPTEKFFIL